MIDIKEVRERFSKDRYATDTTGIVITEVGENYAKVELDINEGHLNAMGGVMGGVFFTMADFAFAVATNAVKMHCVTLSSHIKYLQGARGKHLIAETECVRDGKTTTYYEVKVYDELGTDIARVVIDGYKLTGV